MTAEPRTAELRVTDGQIVAELVDGRTIAIPVEWSWRLAAAKPRQRDRFELIGHDEGVHWPDIDEDISALGMLTGSPARRRPRFVNSP